MFEERYTVKELCIETGLSLRTISEHLSKYGEPKLGVKNRWALYGPKTLSNLRRMHKPQNKFTMGKRLQILEEEVQILKDQCK